MTGFATMEGRELAVRRRDASADGAFYYAVLTTGVFCYPSCAARPALAEHLRFFDTPEAAQAAGYRACKRCRPDLPPLRERERAAVTALCAAMEADRFDGDFSPFDIGQARLRRVFKSIVGVSLSGFQAAVRQKRAQALLSEGRPVTEAMYEAGFNSSGRFYEAADAMLGMTPTAWRRGGEGEVLHTALAVSSLGPVLVACTARGICAILLGDDEASMHADLRARFPHAAFVPGGEDLSRHIQQVLDMIETPRGHHDLPLDIKGTAFQRLVWEALRRIPAGTTTSYGALAASLGKPGSARAVGRACAANPLAVAVPCHRVLGVDGALSGYRWGFGRKAELLRRERE
jgi:AraC family transcriptional regulator of adaptative response/methylated-DNA-[protein]-cysteine methyltransferase